ncbi:nicotinamidase/pyrazinamidase [Limimonas halophila]|uniref:nicotinamidase n=1 Tax=Limimonas halophila TaxID=1082479 RepID=A0A1G7MFT1_9PROT|nr:nicotinamidase [Limimonas halophila]SDF60587.1 nicotinamidase/pyrazinamidase [Limimonas halophila]
MTADPHRDLTQGDAVVAVDVQNDFCPGGALEVPEGDRVVDTLNTWMAAARDAGAHVYASRDWHPRDHISFQPQGGPWPVHCVQDTTGAAFHPYLRLPEDTIVVTKGTRFDKDQYSAFDETGFAEELKRHGIERLWIGGLAEDVCVRATALDAAKHGFTVHVLTEATRAISAESREKTEAELKDAGVLVL